MGQPAARANDWTAGSLAMAVDVEAVRYAYFNPPPEDGFHDVPTLEERLADGERELVRLCLKYGGDPAAERLGIHGALIGGPDKPTTF